MVQTFSVSMLMPLYTMVKTFFTENENGIIYYEDIFSEHANAIIYYGEDIFHREWEWHHMLWWRHFSQRMRMASYTMVQTFSVSMLMPLYTNVKTFFTENENGIIYYGADIFSEHANAIIYYGEDIFHREWEWHHMLQCRHFSQGMQMSSHTMV